MLIMPKARGKESRVHQADREKATRYDKPYRIAIKPIDFFLASEEIDNDHVQRLSAMILEAGIWTTPVPVDGDTGIIMDGNHRAGAAALLHLNYLPCVLLSYQDPRVTVMHWQTGEPFCIAARNVKNSA